MRPIFTIHAGEYLVASEIEKRKMGEVWIPSKDTGTDILLTNKNRNKTVSLQVKFSKDFSETHVMNRISSIKELVSCGWFTFNSKKIIGSEANFWILVLYPAYHVKKRRVSYIVIRPRELFEKIKRIHGKKRRYQSYFWAKSNGECWETRGLGINDQEKIVGNKFSDDTRSFKKYLDNWKIIERCLK